MTLEEEIRLRVPEIVIEGSRWRSRFIHVQTALVPDSQIQLALSIAHDADLLGALAAMPPKWVWERTDSVLWLQAFDRLTAALAADERTVQRVLESLEILLVDGLADASFHGWDQVIALIQTRVERLTHLVDRTEQQTVWRTVYLAFRVLRRHPLLANPRKITRHTPASGGGTLTSVPLFVIDIASSCKTWMERIGRVPPASDATSNMEKLHSFLTQYVFGLESLDDESFSVTAIARTQSSFSICPPTTAGGDSSAYTSAVKGAATNPPALQSAVACRLAALELITLLKPRFIGTYITSYPRLLSELSALIDFDTLAVLARSEETEAIAVSAMDFLGAVLRESAQGDIVSRLLGFETSTGAVLALKKALNDPHQLSHRILFSLIGVLSNRCFSLTGLAQQTVVAGFVPWLPTALGFLLEGRLGSAEAVHERIALTRCLSVAIESSVPLLAQQFRELNGFLILSGRLSFDVDALVDSEVMWSTEWHARAIAVRSSLRLVELCFESLESAGVTNLLQGVDFRSSFSPPMGRIFENPERVSVGTVAITATVLARLISHDPVAISALVQDKVVDAIASCCQNDAVKRSSEALSSIAHCITAICVHEDGEKALQRAGDPLCRDVIPTFADLEAASCWIGNSQIIDVNDFNTGTMIGTAVEELVRNRPAVRPRIISAVLMTIDLLRESDPHESLSDVLHAFTRLIEAICANVDTSSAFVQNSGLFNLMLLVAQMPIAPNFTHVIPAHGLCRLFKLVAQQSSQIQLTSSNDTSPLHNWPSAAADLIEQLVSDFVAAEAENEVDLFKKGAGIHALLHTCALGIKDVPPATNPLVIQHFDRVLEAMVVQRDLSASLVAVMRHNELVNEDVRSMSFFEVISRFACKHAAGEAKSKLEEEKELRRRLRDDRMHSECLFTVFGDFSDSSAVTAELVKGLWMVVRGFMCQVARVVNYPSLPRQTRRSAPLAKVSPQARVAAVNLATLARQMLAVALIELKDTLPGCKGAVGEAVDLLCRLHVEDKHHMTRSLCIDAFFKQGGVDQLLGVLHQCCGTPKEWPDAIQTILWWFERTTSLKRMHNSQLTFLLQKEGEGFDAVGLVSSLQCAFARAFLPHWRNDDCLLNISSKASASLLKAFTHVLEPNERVLKETSPVTEQNVATELEAETGMSLAKLIGWGVSSMLRRVEPSSPSVAAEPPQPRPYTDHRQVVEVAKDAAVDFMQRTLVLGSSDNTNTAPAQTHIADVCVRLSHNGVLKLGPASDQDLVRQLQDLAHSNESTTGRYRAGTVSLTAEELMDIDQGEPRMRVDATRGSVDLASVETEAMPPADSSGESLSDEFRDDFVSYNTRHITATCVRAATAVDSNDRKRRIACTVLACILHARTGNIIDMLGEFVDDVMRLITESLDSGEQAVPVWITSALVVAMKVMEAIKPLSDGETRALIATAIKALHQWRPSLDSQAADALVRIAAECASAIMRKGQFVDSLLREVRAVEALLLLPKSASFDGMHAMAVRLAGGLLSGMLGESLIRELVDETVFAALKRAGKKGVTLAALVRHVRTDLGRLGVYTVDVPALLEPALADKVSWRSVAKRRKTSSDYSQTGEEDFDSGNVVVSLLSDAAVLNPRTNGLPSHIVENLSLLATTLIQRLEERRAGTEQARLFSAEDVLYLMAELCRSADGVHFIPDGSKVHLLTCHCMDNDTSKGPIGDYLLTRGVPLLSALATNAHEEFLKNAKFSLTETNKLIEKFFKLVATHAGSLPLKTATLACVGRTDATDPTFGEVVVVHKAVQVCEDKKNGLLDEALETLKSWAFRHLERMAATVTAPGGSLDVMEGLLDALEVMTRPPIKLRGDIPSGDENTPLLGNVGARSMGQQMGALIEALEDSGANVVNVSATDTAEGGAVAVNIVANQQPRVEESALLGEGNRDDDEIPPNAPSTDAVRDAVRRILSPLVASDAASQFPRFYNSRRRTASTAASFSDSLSPEDFLTPLSNPSVFFTENPLDSEYSFDGQWPTEHPLIARSHTGASGSPGPTALRIDDDILPPPPHVESADTDRITHWLLEHAPMVETVSVDDTSDEEVEVLPEEEDGEEGSNPDADELLDEEDEVEEELMDSPPSPAADSPVSAQLLSVAAAAVVVAEPSGIVALAEAATRLNMTESELIRVTGIDPSVLRDLPEDMHAEIVREYVAQLRPAMDNAAFLQTITQADMREEVMLSAGDEFLQSLPPDLHAEAIMARERRQRRNVHTRRTNAARRQQSNQRQRLNPGLGLLAGAADGAGFTGATMMEWLTTQLNRARPPVSRRQDGFLIIDAAHTAFPPLPASAGLQPVVPRISAATVDKVCAFYDSGDHPPPLPADAVEILLNLVFTVGLRAHAKTALENLLFNLALHRTTRSVTVKGIVEMIPNVLQDEALRVSDRMAAANRLLSILHFLVSHIPLSLDVVADLAAVNGLIALLATRSLEESSVGGSTQKLLLEVLHVLLVPLHEDVPPTTRRHRQKGHKESKVDRLQSTVTADSVMALVQSFFKSQSRAGMEIVKALSETDSHATLIVDALSSLIRITASNVKTALDSNIAPTNDDTRLVELLRLLRSINPRSVTHDDAIDQAVACPELQTVWSSLDQSLAAVSDDAGGRKLFPLVEAFLLAHSNEPATGESLRRSVSRASTPISSSGSRLVRFLEIHRKAVNALVRETPSLLSSSFAVVVSHAPWTLDFDNKRTFFTTKLRQLQDEHGPGQTKLSVRRSEVFMDSFHQLRHRSASEMRGKLSVQFSGEEGVDAGGLVREWFGILAREIFNPNYALFRTAGGKASTFHPNPMSWVNPDHLSFFEFCGRVVGKAMFDDQRLDAYFTRSFYKHMLDSPVSWMDFEVEDPDYYKQLQWILATDLSSAAAQGVAEHLSFTVDVDEFGSVRVVDLVPGGSDISVTESNKRDYVRLVCEYKMTAATAPQVSSFLKGFHELIPADLIGSLFDDKELELLISGLPTINLADLRSNTDYVNFTASSPQIMWLWKVLETDFSQEMLAWFLQFVTGSTQVPLEGFKGLMGMRGPQKFSIHRAYGSDRLPTAHTCFNQLDLPEYKDEAQLREKLIKAVTEAHEGFGFI